MINYELIVKLLELVGEYESSDEQLYKSKPATVDDFRVWLNKRAFEKSVATTDAKELCALQETVVRNFLLASRYSRHLVNKGFEKYPGINERNFSYITVLYENGAMSKSGIAEKNVHTTQASLYIIAKLIELGYAKEETDETDKRTKIISLTKKGKDVYKKIIEEASIITKVTVAPLTNQELLAMLACLKKLNSFHEQLYQDDENDVPVTEILKRISARGTK